MTMIELMLLISRQISIKFLFQQPFNQGGFSPALDPVVSGAPTNSTLVGFDTLSMEENLELNAQNQNDHQFHNTYNVNSNRSQDYDSEEEEDEEDAPNMESDDNDCEDSGLNMLLLYFMDYVCWYNCLWEQVSKVSIRSLKVTFFLFTETL